MSASIPPSLSFFPPVPSREVVAHDPASPLGVRIIDAFDDTFRYRDGIAGWQTIHCYVQRCSDGWEILTTCIDGYWVHVWMRGAERAIQVKSGHHNRWYCLGYHHCECTLWGMRGWCNHHPIVPKALQIGECWQFTQRQRARAEWAACDCGMKAVAA